MKLIIGKVSFLILTGACCLPFSVSAQVIPDRSLGRDSSRVIPHSENLGVQSELIRGGARTGSNLFHSFQEFNVQQNRGVYFENPIGVQNIFTRITGQNISNINGALGVLDINSGLPGNANLFLMNPNGIIFGENARLDLNGSFFATTANSFDFGNNLKFSSRNPQNAPQITTNFTPGLGFGLEFHGDPGVIEVRGEGHNLIEPGDFTPVRPLEGEFKTGLTVGEEQTLALIGGDIIFRGGIVKAPSGHIEIGSVNSGRAEVDYLNIGHFKINYQETMNFKKVSFSQLSLVDASGTKNGNIQIFADNINLTDASLIFVENKENNESGLININAINSTNITGTTNSNQILPGNARFMRGIYSQTFNGKGASIEINSSNFTTKDVSFVISNTYGSGNGGDINLFVKEQVQILGNTVDTSYPVGSSVSAVTYATGNAGNVKITTRNLAVEGGSVITSSVLSQSTGRGGNVNVNVSDSIKVVGFASSSLTPSLLTTVTQGLGEGGDLSVKTKNLILREGGRVDASTVAFGDAGNLSINASETVQLSGMIQGSVNPTLISASANKSDPIQQEIFRLPSRPEGRSGNLFINTPQLIVTNGARIIVRNEGIGNAGNLELNIDRLTLDNSNISATSTSGLGGTIAISGYSPNTPSSLISLSNNSAIETNNSTTTTPNIGTIDIFTRDLHLNNGSSIRATVRDTPENPLDPNLNLVGGNINIRATGNIRVENNSAIAASVQNRPNGAIDGGSITINGGGNIFLGNNAMEAAALTASVDENGNGGDITIELNNGILVSVRDADIRANAVAGDGGNIFIRSFAIFTTPDVEIEASSETGTPGVVQLETFTNQNLIPVVRQQEYQQYRASIRNACIRRNASDRKNSSTSTFNVPELLPKDTDNEGAYEFNLFLTDYEGDRSGDKPLEEILRNRAVVQVGDDLYAGSYCLRKIEK